MNITLCNVYITRWERWTVYDKIVSYHRVDTLKAEWRVQKVYAM